MFELAEPVTSAEFDAYYELRWQALRAPWNMPRGSERDELDDGAIHVAARTSDGIVIGVGRIHKTPEGDAQIRYMATRDTHRGLGVGRLIVERLEQIARELGTQRIVINARENALLFYEKLGYEIFSDSPTLIGTIRHKWMRKQL